MRVAWAWFRARVRLAVVGYVILSVAVTIALSGVVIQQVSACHDRQHQHDAIARLIHKAYAPAKPSQALLDAFPQLKPFYTPGTPQFDAQRRAARAQERAALSTLDTRASC